MVDNGKDINPYLFQLALSLQAGAMQQMGKFASPISGEIERNLEVAKSAIDTLDMLNAKMTGNLSTDEKQLLEHILYELRMNYVDEVNKGEREAATGETNHPEDKGQEELDPEAETTDRPGGQDQSARDFPSD